MPHDARTEGWPSTEAVAGRFQDTRYRVTADRFVERQSCSQLGRDD